MRSKWVLTLVAALTAVSLVVAGVVAAQGPRNAPGAEWAPYVDEDGDGVCDLCGNAGALGYGMRGGMMGRGGYAWGGMFGGSVLEAIADLADVEVDELRAALTAGSTPTEILEQYGLEAADVVDAVLAERRAALEEAVGEGRISREQADWMLEHMEEELTEHLEEGQFGCLAGRGPWNGTAFGAGRGRGGRGMGTRAANAR